MRFVGEPSVTLKDYPGKLSFLVFSLGCNYSCSGCHARRIVYGEEGKSVEETLRLIDSQRQKSSWTNGIVICGGEPTIHEGLEAFCEQMKSRRLNVKIDTNGSNPSVLQRLIDRNLLDYVAMDMKGPLRLYPTITGRDESGIIESLDIVGRFKKREIRTTVFPLFDGELRWFNLEEVKEMAEEIARYSGDSFINHYLQGFRARDEAEMIGFECSLQRLPENMYRTPKKVLENLHEEIKKILVNSRIRD